MMTIHTISNKTVYYASDNKKGSMELNEIVAACGHGVSMEDHVKASVEAIINEDSRGANKKRNKVTSVKII